MVVEDPVAVHLSSFLAHQARCGLELRALRVTGDENNQPDDCGDNESDAT